MSGEKLFYVQNKVTVTRPRLLYYTKNIFTAVFSNICIPINLINRARSHGVNIILDKNDMFNFR